LAKLLHLHGKLNIPVKAIHMVKVTLQLWIIITFVLEESGSIISKYEPIPAV
jgi:hypothetical protein